MWALPAALPMRIVMPLRSGVPFLLNVRVAAPAALPWPDAVLLLPGVLLELHAVTLATSASVQSQKSFLRCMILASVDRTRKPSPPSVRWITLQWHNLIPLTSCCAVTVP